MDTQLIANAMVATVDRVASLVAARLGPATELGVIASEAVDWARQDTRRTMLEAANQLERVSIMYKGSMDYYRAMYKHARSFGYDTGDYGYFVDVVLQYARPGLKWRGDQRRIAAELALRVFGRQDAADEPTDHLFWRAATGSGKSLPVQVASFFVNFLDNNQMTPAVHIIVLEPTRSSARSQKTTCQADVDLRKMVEKDLGPASLEYLPTCSDLSHPHRNAVSAMTWIATPELFDRREEHINDVIRHAAANRQKVIVVSDEAHTTETWGETIRPVMVSVLQRLLGEKVIGLFMSATLDDGRIARLANVLAVTPRVIASPLARPNLFLDVRDEHADAVFADLTDQAAANPEGTFVLFCATRNSASSFRKGVDEALNPGLYTGLRTSENPAAYHTAAASRNAVQVSWTGGVSRVVVATAAFGMGVDALRCIGSYLLGPMFSMNDLVQAAGRAGRDVRMPAFAVFYRSDRAFNSLMWLLREASSKTGTRERALRELIQQVFFTTAPFCLWGMVVNHGTTGSILVAPAGGTSYTNAPATPQTCCSNCRAAGGDGWPCRTMANIGTYAAVLDDCVRLACARRTYANRVGCTAAVIRARIASVSGAGVATEPQSDEPPSDRECAQMAREYIDEDQ